MNRLCLIALVAMVLAVSRGWTEDTLPYAAGMSTMSVILSTSPATEPFFWPVSKVIGTRKTPVVSKFGRRKVPKIPALATSTVIVPADELHEGVDFAVPPESSVRAARSGKVLFAGFSGSGFPGVAFTRVDKTDKNHLVILKHDDGKSSRYVHLNRIMVRPGQVVKAGDSLGLSSGSDEWSESVVHFEIREPNGHPVDPLTLLVQ